MVSWALPERTGDVMDSGVTAVVAAGIAVLGTLLSSVLTQLVSAHTVTTGRQENKQDRIGKRNAKSKKTARLHRAPHHLYSAEYRDAQISS